MIGVSGSRASFCCHVNADEARQPVGDDGESLIVARSASLLSQTRTHAHIRTHTHLLSNMMTVVGDAH